MLIKCKECGGIVSDKAESCPHCGMPNRCCVARIDEEADENVADFLWRGQEQISTLVQQFGKVIQKICEMLAVVFVAFLLLLGHSFVYIILSPSCYDPIVPRQAFLSRGFLLLLPWTFCRPLLACLVEFGGYGGMYYTGRILTGLMWLFAIFVPIFNFEFGFAESIWANAIGVIISILAIGSLRRYVKRLAVVCGEKHDEDQGTKNVEEGVASQEEVKIEAPTGAAPGDEEAMKELERIKEYAARRGERE